LKHLPFSFFSAAVNKTITEDDQRTKPGRERDLEKEMWTA